MFLRRNKRLLKHVVVCKEMNMKGCSPVVHAELDTHMGWDYFSPGTDALPTPLISVSRLIIFQTITSLTLLSGNTQNEC